MAKTLSIDFETRSAVDLKKTGVYPYAEHSSTDIWCMAYAFDDEDVELWVPGRRVSRDGITIEEVLPLPPEVIQHIRTGGEMRAWNASFERIIWREIMVKRYGAPPIRDDQWHDTAAEAAAMALPRSLDQASQVTGVTEQKDDAGYRLMLQMSKPRKVNPDGTYVWWDVPAKLEKLYAYCKQDVRTERAIAKVLRRLTPHEREVFLLDQRINDRGIRIDLDLVDAAQVVVDEGVERANVVLRQLTNGTVSEVTNAKKLVEWLRNQGVDTDSVAKAVVAELLDGDDLTPAVRTALETRAEAGRSSVAKLKSMVEVACKDGRARGLLFYHAASTGRWGGKLLQPHNFPRGEIADVERFIPAVMARDYDLIDLSEPPIIVISSLLRGMLVAAPGHDLIAPDFSAIEARVVNWLAGQEDVLDLFRQLDATHDKRYEPYTVNAMRLYGIPYEAVQKFPHRQLGKAQELGCGFGMGHKKFVTTAKDQYGLTLTEQEAKRAVDNYRATHDRVKTFWTDTEDACKWAIEHPNTPVTFGAEGRLKAVVAGAYLYIVLPSGRPLVYAAPRIVMAPPPWGGEDRPQIEISCVNGYTHKWNRERVYGGLLVENITQAVARDLMADGMLRSEAAGYPPILSVHDEVVVEVPKGFGSVEELEAILSELPEWAEGCPVAAEGWRAERYKKE